MRTRGEGGEVEPLIPSLKTAQRERWPEPLAGAARRRPSFPCLAWRHVAVCPPAGDREWAVVFGCQPWIRAPSPPPPRWADERRQKASATEPPLLRVHSTGTGRRGVQTARKPAVSLWGPGWRVAGGGGVVVVVEEVVVLVVVEGGVVEVVVVEEVVVVVEVVVEEEVVVEMVVVVEVEEVVVEEVVVEVVVVEVVVLVLVVLEEVVNEAPERRLRQAVPKSRAAEGEQSG
ncbi:unnamed protein product [Boreogadus saida]